MRVRLQQWPTQVLI